MSSLEPAVPSNIGSRSNVDVLNVLNGRPQTFLLTCFLPPKPCRFSFYSPCLSSLYMIYTVQKFLIVARLPAGGSSEPHLRL